ncbi:MAG: hypothetical protein K5672_08295 [Bacteroidaceae bacterium]|nr:hypothetical protein [Bacteroidaceae bacterium]
MTDMPNISSQIDALKALQENKQQIKKELNASKDRLRGKIQSIISPSSDSRKKTTRISQLVSNGFAIYEGIRLGISIFSAFRSLFGKKRRRY